MDDIKITKQPDDEPEKKPDEPAAGDDPPIGDEPPADEPSGAEAQPSGEPQKPGEPSGKTAFSLESAAETAPEPEAAAEPEPEATSEEAEPAPGLPGEESEEEPSEEAAESPEDAESIPKKGINKPLLVSLGVIAVIILALGYQYLTKSWPFREKAPEIGEPIFITEEEEPAAEETVEEIVEEPEAIEEPELIAYCDVDNYTETDVSECKPIPPENCELLEMLRIDPVSYSLDPETVPNLNDWLTQCAEVEEMLVTEEEVLLCEEEEVEGCVTCDELNEKILVLKDRKEKLEGINSQTQIDALQAEIDTFEVKTATSCLVAEEEIVPPEEEFFDAELFEDVEPEKELMSEEIEIDETALLPEEDILTEELLFADIMGEPELEDPEVEEDFSIDELLEDTSATEPEVDTLVVESDIIAEAPELTKTGPEEILIALLALIVSQVFIFRRKIYAFVTRK